jgi:hypothetical protein
MYQFGEQDLVYNVNVCILQNISERIPWILKDTLSRQNKGALHELEELKLQKKALMQKLLTGEVRVKV